MLIIDHTLTIDCTLITYHTFIIIIIDSSSTKRVIRLKPQTRVMQSIQSQPAVYAPAEKKSIISLRHRFIN